jgi:hypothetical protein
MGRAYSMLLKAEEIYLKFNEKSIEIKVPKRLLLVLLQQVNRHYEILKYEEEIIINFAVHENISNTEMIMSKLLILMAEPYGKKEIILDINIAEFLVLRDLVFCNYSLPHLREKLRPSICKTYKDFYDEIEGIFEKLEQDEIKAYWDYIKNYRIKGCILH